MNANTVVANTNPLIEARDFTFRFKKDKLGNKRANVELRIPVPSAEGLANIVTEGGKPLECLIDIASDFIRTQVAAWVSDAENASQDTFDAAKFDFSFLANLPKEDRRSAAIPTETWEEFVKDYISVMPGRTGKSAEAVGLAAEIFAKKLLPAKTNKPVLEKLKQQLSIYSESETAEQFEEVLSFLIRRLDAYLAAGEIVVTADMI
jgi:hypothetical protein